MNCREAEVLVEKLADGEASPSERVEAEAHLKGCDGCRAHLELLVAMREASSPPSTEPPAGYFEALPERVLARIEAESPPRRRLPESLRRFGALAAVLVIAAAIGVWVQREGALEDPRTASSESSLPNTPSGEPSPAEGAPEVPAEAPPVPSSADEARAARAPARDIEPETAQDRREETALAELAGEEAESSAAGGRSAEAEGRLGPTEALERLGRARAPAPAVAPALRGTSPERDCDVLRRSLEQTPPTSEAGRDLRFRIATCALERYRSEPSERHRELAIADAEAFLEVERETERAATVLEELERLRE